MRRECKVSVSLTAWTSYSASYLVKLGKSHSVGVFYNKGVCVWQVNSRFDYRGAYEHIYLLLEHIAPYRGKLFFVHFTVGDRYIRVGNGFPYRRGFRLYAVGSVVEVEYLTASAKLLTDSLVYNSFIVFEHIGLYGMSVLRSFLDNRHIAYTAHSHIKRSRNRRSR